MNMHDVHYMFWVRLHMTVRDGAKYIGWFEVPGNHDKLYPPKFRIKKWLRNAKQVIDEYLATIEELPIYEDYDYYRRIDTIDVRQIKMYRIISCIFLTGPEKEKAVKAEQMAFLEALLRRARRELFGEDYNDGYD